MEMDDSNSPEGRGGRLQLAGIDFVYGTQKATYPGNAFGMGVIRVGFVTLQF